MAEFNYDASIAQRIAHNLDRGFVWGTTAQGWDFWRELHDAFKALEDEDELEFEAQVQLAANCCEKIPSTQPSVLSNDKVNQLVYQLAIVFDHRTAPFSDAWIHLIEAFMFLGDRNTRKFDKKVALFVEKVRG